MKIFKIYYVNTYLSKHPTTLISRYPGLSNNLIFQLKLYQKQEREDFVLLLGTEKQKLTHSSGKQFLSTRNKPKSQIAYLVYKIILSDI